MDYFNAMTLIRVFRCTTGILIAAISLAAEVNAVEEWREIVGNGIEHRESPLPKRAIEIRLLSMAVGKRKFVGTFALTNQKKSPIVIHGAPQSGTGEFLVPAIVEIQEETAWRSMATIPAKKAETVLICEPGASVRFAVDLQEVRKFTGKNCRIGVADVGVSESFLIEVAQ